jgi:hypothetical protein
MTRIKSIESLVVEKKKISEMLGPWIETLRIPVVQREFEWDEEKIKLFIDSIVKSYPVGTVILWETYDELPYAKIVGENEKQNLEGPFRYVIDGQQRLLSLMLLANSWKITRGVELIDREPISFNPSSDEFRIGTSVGIPVSLLFNASRGKVSALKEISSKYKDYEGPLESIGGGISNYELPIYTLRSKRGEPIDPEAISDIFTRINTSGVRLGNLEIFLSFFASTFPSLKELILKRYKDLNELYEDEYPTWEVCIRTVFGNLGKSQSRITRKNSFKNTIKEVKDEYDSNTANLEEIINKSFDTIGTGLDLIKRELGINRRRFMPSHTVMIPVYKWMFINNHINLDEISGENRNRILRWFLIASVNNYYSNWTERKLDKTLDAINRGGDFPIEELLTQMASFKLPDKINVEEVTYYESTRSSHILLLSILYRKGASDWAGHSVSDPNITIQHIFPQDLLRRNNIPSEYINTLSNLTLINKSVNSQIQDMEPKDYFPKYESELTKHIIPLSKKYWKFEEFNAFIEERDKMIRDEIKNLMKSLE